MFRTFFYLIALSLGLGSTQLAASEHYVIDTKGMHAFITFKVKHLGFSWLEGRFNRFSGEFDYDSTDPTTNRVRVEIDLTSLDSNHAERDKHLRSKRFFDVKAFPNATFVSTAWEDKGNGKALLKGRFSLRGVTRNIEMFSRSAPGPIPGAATDVDSRAPPPFTSPITRCVKPRYSAQPPRRSRSGSPSREYDNPEGFRGAGFAVSG